MSSQLFSDWLASISFESVKREREKEERRARQTTEVKREALAHLTNASLSTDLHTPKHTHTDTHTQTHSLMRMGFRPVVNMSAPLGANINSIFSSTTSRSFVNPFLNQSAFTVDNHHQQPAKDQTDDLDDPDLQVELENKQLWDAFHTNGTEMVRESVALIDSPSVSSR